MYDLILYDTSNFEDFPIGGQLTSIRNFLKYIADCRPGFSGRVLLVGVGTDPDTVGRITTVTVGAASFAFLPVLYREPELANVKKSLRLEYVKALCRLGKKIPCGKKTVHFIHTPEAFLAVKLQHPGAKTAVFSHGSFFNMVQGFRFFQKNRVVHVLFEQFLVILLKTADLLFVLDDATLAQYRNYTSKVCRADNSILLPESVPLRQDCHRPIRLLFAGRLSGVKQIDRIIDAVSLCPDRVHLTIVGDGEVRASLQQQIAQKKLEEYVTLFLGCAPSQMGEYYQSSDILVMNSSLEGKPMVILEAMSHGLPVIATPVGGIPELVTPGVQGEFTDGTPEQILEKTEKICAAYADYARNALAAAANYDYKQINGQIFERIMQL